MPRTRRSVHGLVLAFATVVAAVPAGAEIFRWTDAQGRMHFTERIEKVPPAHRAEARRNADARRGGRVNTYSGATGSGAAAPAPPRTTFRSAGGVIEIPFTRVGSLMRVEAVVNDVVRVPFLVDTGASGVSLPGAYASQLGLRIRSDHPHVEVSTANGVVSRPVVTLDSVELHGARVENLGATVNPSMEIGLLGGSFFNNYVYSVDAAKGVMSLRPNERIRGGVGPEEWQRRFRALLEPLARLDAYLRDHPDLRERERERLGARQSALNESLEQLERHADDAGVPPTWRH